MGEGRPACEGRQELPSGLVKDPITIDKGTPMPKNDDTMMKEVKRIRNLLILIALRSGASSDEVHYATGMGAANIRAMLPIKRGKRKNKKSD